MSKFVLKNAYLSVGGTNLSNYVKQITLNYSAEVLDNTCMGDTSKTKVVGYKDWSIDVEFAQDFGAGAVDATLFTAVGTSVAVEVRPDAGTASASNPKFTGNAILQSYSPINGSVGQPAAAPSKFEGTGDLARATT